MKSSPTCRKGFSLVELLIVIAIIAVLVAVTIPAVIATVGTAKRTQIATELSQLKSAIEQYKSENGGAYPPDFTGYPEAPVYEKVLIDHMLKCYPRCGQNLTVWKDLNLGTANLYKPSTLDPAEALVFWLSMIRNNPQRPLPWIDGSPLDNSTAPVKNYFTFEQARLRDIDNDGWLEYYPRNSADVPYVYFCANTYGFQTLFVDHGYPRKSISATYPQPAVANTFGTARPYAKRVDPMNLANVLEWVEPNKFQILCGGLDRYFGDDVPNPGNATLVLAKLFPIGENYTPVVEEDNITSFSEGRTLGGNRP